MLVLYVDYDIRKLIDRGNKALWLERLIPVSEPEHPDECWLFLIDLDWDECGEMARMIDFCHSHYYADIYEIEPYEYDLYCNEIELFRPNDDLLEYFLQEFGVAI